MKLEKIKINSFKSVINKEIIVNDECIGFVGLNESGKSNLLQSINHLNKKKNFAIADKSKLNGQLPSIEYSFCLWRDDKKEVLKRLNRFLVEKDIVLGEKDIIEDFNATDIVFTKEMKIVESKYKTLYNLKFNYEIKISSKYKILSTEADFPDDATASFMEDEYLLSVKKIIQSDLIPKEYESFYEKNKVSEIEKLINRRVQNILSGLLPSVEFWEYTPKYLLPAEIVYDEFISEDDPYENNAPLFNMLLISEDLGIYDENDVISKVNEWKADSSLRRKDSNILTRDINEHIKSVWKDYDQELKIELEESKVTIHVNDPKSSVMNYYDMSSRSQGFKTFISFILTISAEAKTGLIENFVIILDEPETHLHPSGVKYMREELLKLSTKNNHVFFATHSIFMIDRSNLRRHIIVKKENEHTNLNVVTRNNILQEDIIYQALGTSIDEFSISNNNILFEGEMDVKLFSYFIENCIAKKNNKLIDYDLLDGGGTNRMHTFFKEKTLPINSKWTFILDKDAPGRNLPDNIKKSTLEAVYKNIDFIFYSDNVDYELEDILPKNIIENAFKEAIKDVVITFEFDINNSKPVSKIIEEFYGRNKLKGDEKSHIEETFKSNIEQSLDVVLKTVNKETNILYRLAKFKELLPQYFDFIKNVLAKFEMKID
ncbi:MAG: AAA family ATPase [Bacteroidales bacterium]|nr:AAA family ATPase [Bacteroidales bacterium]